MSEAAAEAVTDKPPAAEANGQLIVALAIVVGLVLIAIGIMVDMIITKDTTMGVALGTTVGILGTALNAPTGIGNVIKQAKKDVAP